MKEKEHREDITKLFLDTLIDESLKCDRCKIIMKSLLSFPNYRGQTKDIYALLSVKMQKARINKHLQDLTNTGFLIKFPFGEGEMGVSYVISYKYFQEIIPLVEENVELNKTAIDLIENLLDAYFNSVYGYMEGMKDSYKRAINASQTYTERIKLLREFFNKI